MQIGGSTFRVQDTGGREDVLRVVARVEEWDLVRGGEERGFVGDVHVEGGEAGGVDVGEGGEDGLVEVAGVGASGCDQGMGGAEEEGAGEGEGKAAGGGADDVEGH